ncbi:MAG: hypothetical protein ABSG57_05200 [Candidatus Bathyarchaeia archaeon]
MNQGSRGYTRRHYEGILSAISVGFFLILIGTMFVTTPNLLDKVVTFLSHFNVVQVGNTNIYVPAPEHLGDHIDVYLAAREFSLVWGVFLIAALGARFLFDSPLRRKAENIGDIVFWLGATYLIQTFLVAPTQTSVIDVTKWFEFWAAVVMFIGVSLIARAIFLAAVRARNI